MAKARFEILPSTVLAASGATGPFTLNFQTMLAALVDVTAVTGTTPVLNLWIQGSDDGGTTWADVECNSALKTDAGGANVAATRGSRNINGGTNITAAGQWSGIYEFFPYDTFRLKWIITGTFTAGQGFTTSSSVVAK